MSRRILVRVSPQGEIQVEAEGFAGNGCEAATRAIEEALGRKTSSQRKPEYYRHSHISQNEQKLGGSES